MSNDNISLLTTLADAISKDYLLYSDVDKFKSLFGDIPVEDSMNLFSLSMGVSGKLLDMLNIIDKLLPESIEGEECASKE